MKIFNNEKEFRQLQESAKTCESKDQLLSVNVEYLINHYIRLINENTGYASYTNSWKFKQKDGHEYIKAEVSFLRPYAHAVNAVDSRKYKIPLNYFWTEYWKNHTVEKAPANYYGLPVEEA